MAARLSRLDRRQAHPSVSARAAATRSTCLWAECGVATAAAQPARSTDIPSGSVTQPRIRSIKPEIWQSRDFRALSHLGKLAFIALWSNADDEGRMRTDAAHLASVYVDAPTELVAKQLETMEVSDMVRLYRVAHV